MRSYTETAGMAGAGCTCLDRAAWRPGSPRGARAQNLLRWQKPIAWSAASTLYWSGREWIKRKVPGIAGFIHADHCQKPGGPAVRFGIQFLKQLVQL